MKSRKYLIINILEIVLQVLSCIIVQDRMALFRMHVSPEIQICV